MVVPLNLPAWRAAWAVLNFPFTGSCVTFTKAHQSLHLSYLSCIVGMTLIACFGGMLRKLKEVRYMAVFRKVLWLQYQMGSLSLFVFHHDCLSFWVMGWDHWVSMNHSSKKPCNWGLGFGDLHSLCQPCEPAGVLWKLTDWWRSKWRVESGSVVIWTKDTWALDGF